MRKQKDIQSGNDGRNNHSLYVLHLYISGAASNSLKAVNNVIELGDTYLEGNYSLEIIDVYQQKSLAKNEHLIALPVLIKSFPLPEKRIVGDLSDTHKVLKRLGYSA